MERTALPELQRHRFATGWAAAALCCALLWLLPQLGNAALWGFAGLIVLGVLRVEWRGLSWRAALGGLYGACAALALHLLADHFQLRYAWLYSSAALPGYLKLSNLWGRRRGHHPVAGDLLHDQRAGRGKPGRLGGARYRADRRLVCGDRGLAGAVQRHARRLAGQPAEPGHECAPADDLDVLPRAADSLCLRLDPRAGRCGPGCLAPRRAGLRRCGGCL